jgi:hypothetical protein
MNPAVAEDLSRNTVIRQIKVALERRSGKPWSVTGGRGPAYGWITIDAPPRRRVWDFEGTQRVEAGRTGYASLSDRRDLATLLGLQGFVHAQGQMIPAGHDYYREFLDRAEGRPPRVHGTPYWDNPRRDRRRRLTAPEQHLLRIARATLRMPDPMVGVMGGPDKPTSRRIIRELTGRTPRRRNPPPEEKIAQLRRIVETKTRGRVTGQMIDLFTASAILQVHDALSPANRAKYVALPISRMATVAFQLGTRAWGNPYRVVAFAREKPKGRRLREYGYDVLGPYDSPTRLPGTGSFIFPTMQPAKYHASREFLDPRVHQVAIKTLQDQDVLRLFRRTKQYPGPLARNPWVVRRALPGGRGESCLFKTHPQAKQYQERHSGKIYYAKRVRPLRPKRNPDRLADVAVEIAARAAVAYLRQHNIDADPRALEATLKSWVKIKLPEALRDAKQALEAGMGQAAEATFKASMALAGIEAAKEAGFPRGMARNPRLAGAVR